MQKIIFIFIKLKLLKKENILFVVFNRLFNLSKITFFNILSTINSPKFKSLPLRFLYFEELNNLVKENFSEINYENKNILEVGGGNTWGLMPFFAKNNASIKKARISTYGERAEDRFCISSLEETPFLKKSELDKLISELKESLDFKAI